MMKLTLLLPLLCSVFLLVFSQGLLANDVQKKEQAKLDQVCENARQEALKPQKLEIYNECVTKLKKSPEVCKNDAAQFNGNRINGAPLYYDLPECVKAFEYKKKTQG